MEYGAYCDNVIVCIDVLKHDEWIRPLEMTKNDLQIENEIEETSKKIEHVISDISLQRKFMIYATTYHITNDGLVGDRLYGRLGKIIPTEKIISKTSFGTIELIEKLCSDFICIGKFPKNIIICGFFFSRCVIANAILCKSRFTRSNVFIATDLTYDNDICTNAAKLISGEQQIIIKTFDEIICSIDYNLRYIC